MIPSFVNIVGHNLKAGSSQPHLALAVKEITFLRAHPLNRQPEDVLRSLIFRTMVSMVGATTITLLEELLQTRPNC